jgi:hypothetical protein
MLTSRVLTWLDPETRIPRFAPCPFEFTKTVDDLRLLRVDIVVRRVPVPENSTPVTVEVFVISAHPLVLLIVIIQLRMKEVAAVVPPNTTALKVCESVEYPGVILIDRSSIQHDVPIVIIVAVDEVEYVIVVF